MGLGRRLIYLSVPAIVVAVLLAMQVISTLGPPPISLFVEDWEECPSAFENLAVMGPVGYYRPHNVELKLSFTPPERFVVYRYKADVELVERIAKILGLSKTFEHGGDKPTSRFVTYENGTATLVSEGYVMIKYYLKGYERPLVSGEPLIGGEDVEVAGRWLEGLGVTVPPEKLFKIAVRGYTVEYYLRFENYVPEYPAISVTVVGGRVVYAHISLASLLAEPWKAFKPRSIDNAARILKATLDIGGVLRNAWGWSEGVDARLLASFNTDDFHTVVIGDVEVTYSLVWRGDYAYIVPVYAFRGVTDKGEAFRGYVDAIDRSNSEPLST